MANILVCDDDKDIVEAISIYLEQEGYTVLKAYDGVEAINAVRSQSVDLLIIDIMMPKLDGIRATLKIREENPLPIIILSAKSEDADKGYSTDYNRTCGINAVARSGNCYKTRKRAVE